MPTIILRPTSGSATGVTGSVGDVNEEGAPDGNFMGWGDSDDNVGVKFAFGSIGVAGTINSIVAKAHVGTFSAGDNVTVESTVFKNTSESVDVANYSTVDSGYNDEQATHSGLGIDIETEWDGGKGFVQFKPLAIPKSTDLQLDKHWIEVTYTEEAGEPEIETAVFGKLFPPSFGDGLFVPPFQTA